MNRSNKITIDQIKKLIPINDGIVNFTANISIVAASDKEFSMAIISKNLLETTTDIPYKQCSKEVSFSVRNENDVYQPYVMVLKSEVPQEVVVNISLNELPKTINTQTPVVREALGQAVDSSPWYKDWKYWAIILVIVAIFAYFYLKNQRGKKEPVVVLDTQPLSLQR